MIGQQVIGAGPRGVVHEHAVDSVQRHAAQDEGHDRGRKVAALREPAGSDCAVPPGCRAGVRERMAPHGVHSARPAFALQGLAGDAEFIAGDDVGGAELPQIAGFLRLAGGSGDGVAQACQQRDGDRSNASRRTGHEHGPIRGLEPVLEQCHHAKRGGVSGGADGGGCARCHVGAQAQQPALGQARLLRETAPVGLAHAPAVHHDTVTGLPGITRAGFHGARQVDAGDQRPFAHDGAVPRDSQRVLKIETGVLHANGDVPLRQCSVFERPDFGNSLAVLLGEVERVEHGVSHLVVEPRRAFFLQRGEAFPQFGPVEGKDLKRGRVVE